LLGPARFLPHLLTPMSTPTVPAAAPLRFIEKLGYGLGDTASNFFFQTFNIFLMYYYTDVYGLSVTAVSTMLLVTRGLDAFAEPVVGMIADRTRSRWGKFRPYLLWVAIPYGVLGYMVFAGPQFSPTGKLMYAYAVYAAMMLAYSFINIPYSALMGVMSPSSSERASLSTFRFVCAFGGGFLITSLVSPLKNVLGGGNEALGFKLTMGVFAVASVALFWFTFATTRERVQSAGEHGASLRSDLKFLGQNRPWLAMFFAAIFTLLNVGVRNAGAVYFLKYYVKDDGRKVFWIFDHTALFMTTGMFALILGVASTGFFRKRWDKRGLLRTLTALNALSMGAIFLLRPDQLGWMYAINIVGTFLAGPTPALVWAMYSDTADYGEWKFNRRTTGLVFSAALFAQKAGNALGVALAGFILARFGFQPNTAQSEQALLGIRIVYCLAPMVFALLNVAALMFYPLTDGEVSRMEKELAERRAGESAAVPSGVG
jgi:glycoside/pentoside/hexuronide:cation symporter, GPH family